jgi:hypothetical protein
VYKSEVFGLPGVPERGLNMAENVNGRIPHNRDVGKNIIGSAW